MPRKAQEPTPATTRELRKRQATAEAATHRYAAARTALRRTIGRAVNEEGASPTAVARILGTVRERIHEIAKKEAHDGNGKV